MLKAFDVLKFAPVTGVSVGLHAEFDRDGVSVLFQNDQTTWSLHDTFKNGSMTPLVWVMTPCLKGHGDSR